MSREYIIHIDGKDRYDLPNCVVEGNCIRSWNKYKKIMFLTDNDCRILYNAASIELKTSVSEQMTKRGLTLVFGKPIDGDCFDNILCEFVNSFKMCNICYVPEVVYGFCNACGNCNAHIKTRRTRKSSSKR